MMVNPGAPFSRNRNRGSSRWVIPRLIGVAWVAGLAAFGPMSAFASESIGERGGAKPQPPMRTASENRTAPSACPSLLQHTFNHLQTGESQSLCRYQGQVLLIVNTASYCGYTNQYDGLDALYRKYKERGLVVLGFPSNDFGAQEPGSNTEIAEFCRTTYGVRFPLYEKTTVAGLARNPLYAELARATGQAPKWNFHKYIVDRDGRPVASFASGVTPDAREVTTIIERLLAQKSAAAKS